MNNSYVLVANQQGRKLMKTEDRNSRQRIMRINQYVLLALLLAYEPFKSTRTQMHKCIKKTITGPAVLLQTPPALHNSCYKQLNLLGLVRLSIKRQDKKARYKKNRMTSIFPSLKRIERRCLLRQNSPFVH